jgi:excisionase family DNA binding protein
MALITVKQAAAELGLQPITIRRWIAKGQLKGYKLGDSRVVRIDPKDVRKLLQPVK